MHVSSCIFTVTFSFCVCVGRGGIVEERKKAKQFSLYKGKTILVVTNKFDGAWKKLNQLINTVHVLEGWTGNQERHSLLCKSISMDKNSYCEQWGERCLMWVASGCTDEGRSNWLDDCGTTKPHPSHDLFGLTEFKGCVCWHHKFPIWCQVFGIVSRPRKMFQTIERWNSPSLCQ